MTNESVERLTTRRPVTIWVALGVLAIYIALLILGSYFPFERSVLDQMEPADEIRFQLENLVILASFVAAFVAIWKRKRWGRWFLIAPIVYLVGSIGFEELFYVDPNAGDPEYSEEALIVLAILLAFPLISFLLVSVGDSAKAYFSLSKSTS